MAKKKPRFWQVHIITAISLFYTYIFYQPGFKKAATGITAIIIMIANLATYLRERRLYANGLQRLSGFYMYIRDIHNPNPAIIKAES